MGKDAYSDIHTATVKRKHPTILWLLLRILSSYLAENKLFPLQIPLGLSCLQRKPAVECQNIRRHINALCGHSVEFWLTRRVLDCVWNVMAHAQKPGFVFLQNGRVHLHVNRRGASVQSTAGSRGVRISGSNGEYIMFRGSVKGTGYPTPFASFPFTPPPVRQRVPSRFNWTLHRVTDVLQRVTAFLNSS